MMNTKTMICLALAALLLFSCLTGCQSTAEPPAAAPTEHTEEPRPAALLSAVTDAKPLGFSAFDNQLVEYLKQTGLAEENFTVSPLSFKAALTMAALGSEGETQAQLLEALGFQSVDELRGWYATVLAGVDEFETYFALLDRLSDGEERTAAYQVVNSIWSNQDLPGEFRQSFLDDVARVCRAEAYSAQAAALAAAVNDWVNEQTKGLIPRILNDASDAAAILVNALYLKSGWEKPFTDLGEQDFTTNSGETVQKSFMVQTERLRYYRDDETQLVCVPLQGGVTMVFVLGDDAGLADKLNRAETKRVEVTVPKFDVETSLERGELVGYLRLMGCEKMFTGEAEFDPMYTAPLYVDDIIQKAKVHIDEEGLEAAAVTAIIMKYAGIMPAPEEPEVFCADRPFSFYVLKDGDTPELLFWGQIVK